MGSDGSATTNRRIEAHVVKNAFFSTCCAPSLVTASKGAYSIDNLDLPYPRSSVPTGQGGRIYVWSEFNQTLSDRVAAF